MLGLGHVTERKESAVQLEDEGQWSHYQEAGQRAFLWRRSW